MWRALMLLAVVTVAAAGESGLGQVLEPRLAASGVRIARLEKVLASLKKQVEDAADIDPRGFAKELHARMDAVKKTKFCPNPNTLQCGWTSSECVSSLLLCDGTKDCHNGWDEDEHTCTPGPIKAGNVFSGNANWVSCLSRQDHPISFQIVSAVKAKSFGARLIVRAKVTVDYVEEHHNAKVYDVKGYYVYGAKKLVLVPVDDSTGEDLAVVCKWNHGDDDRAECKLAQEATLHKCAEFHVSHQN